MRIRLKGWLLRGAAVHASFSFVKLNLVVFDNRIGHLFLVWKLVARTLCMAWAWLCVKGVRGDLRFSRISRIALMLHV